MRCRCWRCSAPVAVTAASSGERTRGMHPLQAISWHIDLHSNDLSTAAGSTVQARDFATVTRCGVGAALGWLDLALRFDSSTKYRPSLSASASRTQGHQHCACGAHQRTCYTLSELRIFILVSMQVRENEGRKVEQICNIEKQKKKMQQKGPLSPCSHRICAAAAICSPAHCRCCCSRSPASDEGGSRLQQDQLRPSAVVPPPQRVLLAPTAPAFD